MRIHLPIVLGSAMTVVVALCVGCSREGSSQGASAPTTYMPYSTTNAGSNAYGSAGTGYSTPTATGGGPASNSTNDGGSSTTGSNPSTGANDTNGTNPSSACAGGNCGTSGTDAPGFDHSTLKGTGSTDNVPTGVGGGPIDKGTTNPDNGVTNDDDTDKSLNPGSGDNGKSDIPQPLDKKSKGDKGKKKTPPKTTPEEGM